LQPEASWRVVGMTRYVGIDVGKHRCRAALMDQKGEIVSNFAGEPALDAQGNLYFVHHYFTADGKMIEADIYVAYKK